MANVEHSISVSSPAISEERLQVLRETFPEAFTEGRIDFDKLRASLGELIDDRLERYSFTWAGKRDAIRLLQTPTRATLIPCREESVDFDATQNIFIEGDNLEVLKLLYKPYFGRVKMIYIDPPYNTGNDFIYPDDYADPLGKYLELTGQQDAAGNLLTSNPETSGRYHSAWLSMMYPRLFLARQFLSEDGFIVVSIDDSEVTDLRLILNETYGEENFIATIVWDRNRKNDATFFSVGHEYMLVYARNKQYLKENGVKLRAPKEGIDEAKNLFDELRIKYGEDYSSIEKGIRDWFSTFEEDDPRIPLARFNKVDSGGPYRDDGNINWPGGGGPTYDVIHPVTGKPCKKPKSGWRFSKKERMDEEIAKGNIIFGPDETTIPSIKWYLFSTMGQVMRSVDYSYAQTATNEFDAIFDGVRVFENPKHYSDLSQMVEYLSDDDSIVMDFFAGSCSLAHAILHTNQSSGSSRRFICIQLPEPVNPKKIAGKNAIKLGLFTVADIGKERIRRTITRMKKVSDNGAQIPLPLESSDNPDDLGFRVYKLALSHFKPWVGVTEQDPAEYAQQMELFHDPLVEGWTVEGVLAELAVKYGFGLGYSIQTISSKAAGEVTFYRVLDAERSQAFHVCLDEKVSLEMVQALELGPDDLFICRDTALDDDTTANLALQCRLETI